MIVADRRELETSVRQRAMQIQREELNVFVDNMQTLGTQSAFLAGLGWSAMTLDYEATDSLVVEMGLYVSGALAVGLHILCAFICAFTTIRAPALAIRGPDGSMTKALAGMYEERKLSLRLYGFGLFFILTNGIFVVRARTQVPTSIAVGALFGAFMIVFFLQARRLAEVFRLPVAYRRVGGPHVPARSSLFGFAAAPESSSARPTNAEAMAPASDAPAVRYASMLRRTAAQARDPGLLHDEGLSEPLCGESYAVVTSISAHAAPARAITPPQDRQPACTPSNSGDASAASVNAPSAVSGALRKRGGKMTSYWKLRYFSLTAQALEYYSLEGDLKETFNLQDQPVLLDGINDAELAFTLTIGGKVLQLQALNAPDFERWVQALSRLCSPARLIAQ